MKTIKKEKIFHIKLSNNDKITFSDNGVPGDIFICGFIEGLFGEYDKTFKCFGFGDAVAEGNMQMLLNTLKTGHKVRLLCDDKTKDYMDSVISDFVNCGVLDKKFAKPPYYKALSCGTHYTPESYEKAIEESMEKVYNYSKKVNMKFDYIIQNPPYNGSLHLDFLEKGLDLLTEKGRMVIIEPATFFIDLRKWGKRGILGRTNSDDILKYDKVKSALRGHIVSASLDNQNNPFGTSLYFPFVTTVIDFSKTYNEFEFNCFGEKRIVKDPYDCNLIGNYDTVWSILNKVLNYGDMLKGHITNKYEGPGMYYTKYIEINPYVGCIIGDGKHDRRSIEEHGYIKNSFGEYLKSYFSGGYFRNLFSENDANQIYDSIPKKLANGATYARPKYSDKNCECVYGTKEELENWEYNLCNTKLMIFICLALTIDQHTHVTDFLPFLVKKKYTDEEINEMFGFTDKEIALIDRTIKKYERNSPWFKRYMCGPDSVSDEEVNNFINNL